MQKLVKKLKNRKGFTLVEVMVVLVILAILAAVLIPSLTGYIDRANEKAAVAECRSVVVAAQTVISETYAAGLTIKEEDKADKLTEITTLAELTATDLAQITVAGGKITEVIYQNATTQVTYTNDGGAKYEPGTVDADFTSTLTVS